MNIRKVETRFSNFWLKGKLQKEGGEINPVTYSSALRSVTNFVSIVTGKRIPVSFAMKGKSRTDSKSITISSDLSSLDTIVGLALHEATHITDTDFWISPNEESIQYYKDTVFFRSKIPQEIKRRVASKYKITDQEKLAKFFYITLFRLQNWVEDRRIDALQFKKAPGYRGYYEAMYRKYFYAPQITKGLQDKEFLRDETWDSYIFRIFNIHNKKSDLNALKALKDIWTVLDLKNIERLRHTDDSLKVAIRVFELVENQVQPIFEEKGDEEEDKKEDPNQQKQQGSGGNSGGDSNDGKSGGGDGNDGEENEGENESEKDGKDEKKDKNNKSKGDDKDDKENDKDDEETNDSSDDDNAGGDGDNGQQDDGDDEENDEKNGNGGKGGENDNDDEEEDEDDLNGGGNGDGDDDGEDDTDDGDGEEDGTDGQGNGEEDNTDGQGNDGAGEDDEEDGDGEDDGSGTDGDGSSEEDDDDDEEDEKKYEEDLNGTVEDFLKGKKVPAQKTGKLSEADVRRIMKNIKKQVQAILGQIEKAQLSKEDNDKITVVNQSKTTEVETGGDTDKGNIGHVDTVVVRSLTMDLIRKDPFNMFSTNPDYDIIKEGIALGNKLAKKLRVQSEEKSVVYNRQQKGKLDKRMVHSLGFGSESVFHRVETETSNETVVYVSVDGSGSMSGGKWDSAQTFAISLAQVASMLEGFRVILTYRYTFNPTDDTSYSGHYQHKPLMLMAYDSKTDNMSKIKELFPYLHAYSFTPEGLCFEAIQREIIESNQNTDVLLINLSDGMPQYTHRDGYKTFEYSGERALAHTRREVEKFWEKGIEVLSYFITDSNDSSSLRHNFRQMYGKDATFIDFSSLTQLAMSLNKKFLRKVKR